MQPREIPTPSDNLTPLHERSHATHSDPDSARPNRWLQAHLKPLTRNFQCTAGAKLCGRLHTLLLLHEILRIYSIKYFSLKRRKPVYHRWDAVLIAYSGAPRAREAHASGATAKKIWLSIDPWNCGSHVTLRPSVRTTMWNLWEPKNWHCTSML